MLVYKNYDPRAKIMQKMCHAVLAETGHGDDPMLKVALEQEKIALSDQYFIPTLQASQLTRLTNGHSLLAKGE